MEEPQIRPVRLPEDADQLAALYAETAAWHAERWPREWTAPGPEPRLADELTRPLPEDFCLLVAELDGWLIGFVSGSVRPKPTSGLLRYDGPVLTVADLMVSAEYRRRGLGAELLRRLEEWGTRHGATAVTLNVDDRNQAAQTLYERAGFRRVIVQLRKDLDVTD